ncbi:SCP2 sterol-binding domain-containing protein 1 isoform X6 [Callithrix jacchus]
MGRTYLAGPENRRARYVSQKSCLASLSPGEMPAPASPSAMLKGSLRPHQQLSICQCHPCTACRTLSVVLETPVCGINPAERSPGGLFSRTAVVREKAIHRAQATAPTLAGTTEIAII